MLVAIAASFCAVSPFEATLPDGMRDLTARNLQKLAQRGARPPASPEHPLTLAFLADTHEGYDELAHVVDYINGRPEIELVLHAGDFTNHGTALEYRWAYAALTRLRAPFFVAPGNHDGLANGPLLHGLMFGPENFAVAWAGIHFLVFNTNPNEWGHAAPDVDWLKTELARAHASPGERAWIVTHHPPSSPPHLDAAQSMQLWRAMRAGGVDAYLYGHLHDHFGAREVSGISFVKAQTALTGAFYVVTTDGAHLQLEACVVDACTPAHPATAPGTDPPPPEPLR